MCKTITALLTVALGFGTLAAAQSAPPASVYFLDTVGWGARAVWIDGQKVFPSEFAGALSSVPRAVPAGRHHIVVTPISARPGEQDIVSADMEVPGGGTYVLKLKKEVPPNSADGFKMPTLVMVAGEPR